MKKLSKLKINPDKLMKNDELMTIQGGYGCDYYCWVYLSDGTPAFSGVCCSSDYSINY